MPETLHIYPHHLRSVPFGGQAGYCASGARDWFARHGLSWGEFIAHGIAAHRLAATGCPLAAAVIAHAAQLAIEGKGHG